MDDLEQSTDLAEEAGQLREALASQGPIEQATGIVLVLCASTPQGAFGRLTLASMSHNVKLASLAAAIVDVVATPSPVFTRSVTPRYEHIVALELLEHWGMDFGPALAGMQQRRTQTQRHGESLRAAAHVFAGQEGSRQGDVNP